MASAARRANPGFAGAGRSHDRVFLDNITTHVSSRLEPGVLSNYPGRFSDYLALWADSSDAETDTRFDGCWPRVWIRRASRPGAPVTKVGCGVWGCAGTTPADAEASKLALDQWGWQRVGW